MDSLKYRNGILLLISMIYWTGCWGSSETPVITLSAVDCAKDDITIEATKSVSGSTSNWVILIEIVVKCSGNALPGAELKFTPWIGDQIKLTTDSQGKSSYRRRTGERDRPAGSVTVTVEIEGSDGTKTESITVP